MGKERVCSSSKTREGHLYTHWQDCGLMTRNHTDIISGGVIKLAYILHPCGEGKGTGGLKHCGIGSLRGTGHRRGKGRAGSTVRYSQPGANQEEIKYHNKM